MENAALELSRSRDGDGDGSGYGYGYGYGDGSGDGSGDGDGDGSGSGYGYGDGYGDGYGSGYGYGSGSGSGYGYGYGYGSGYGYGYGYGDGSGDGSGSGYGYGDGYGYFTALLAPYESPNRLVAFWKCTSNGSPANGGNSTKAKVGLVEEIPGPLAICTSRALHGTGDPRKWKGTHWWIVALHHPVQQDGDKFASLKREFLVDLGKCPFKSE